MRKADMWPRLGYASTLSNEFSQASYYFGPHHHAGQHLGIFKSMKVGKNNIIENPKSKYGYYGTEQCDLAVYIEVMC